MGKRGGRQRGERHTLPISCGCELRDRIASGAKKCEYPGGGRRRFCGAGKSKHTSTIAKKLKFHVWVVWQNRLQASEFPEFVKQPTARHVHTTFHASRLSPILALSCAFKILKNKNTVWSILEQAPPITPSIPHPTRSYAARILVSSSSEAQTPRFKPPEREKHPSFTWLDLTNAIPTAMLSRHMQRYVTE